MEKKDLTIIIFGGTGDLAGRKLIPALFDLYTNKLLPNNLRIVGFGRKDLSNKVYREFVKQSLSKKRDAGKNKFINNFSYHRGDLTNEQDYRHLAEYLGTMDFRSGVCSNKLFHLAVPPELYEPVFKNLSKSGMTLPCISSEENKKYWTRVLVEKPFGKDLKQAIALDKLLGKSFMENQIFRIDHYLAKETVQNILTFRFANTIFEPVWTSKHIKSVNIRLYENIDINKRGASYDPVGELRDMGQSHILQLLALVAMEDPGEFNADKIQSSRALVLSQTKPNFQEPIIRGQYIGYKKELNVKHNSDTETYFKLALNVNNKRFKDVPFYIESGKALDEKKTEIEIVFDNDKNQTNKIIFSIQPDEKITIQFWVKKTGFNYKLNEKNLTFHYNEEDAYLHDAYEKVLYDCVRGDQTLFPSTAEVLAQWRIITPILEYWKSVPLKKYKKGIKSEFIIKNKK